MILVEFVAAVDLHASLQIFELGKAEYLESQSDEKGCKTESFERSHKFSYLEEDFIIAQEEINSFKHELLEVVKKFRDLKRVYKCM